MAAKTRETKTRTKTGKTIRATKTKTRMGKTIRATKTKTRMGKTIKEIRKKTIRETSKRAANKANASEGMLFEEDSLTTSFTRKDHRPTAAGRAVSRVCSTSSSCDVYPLLSTSCTLCAEIQRTIFTRSTDDTCIWAINHSVNLLLLSNNKPSHLSISHLQIVLFVINIAAYSP